VRLRHPNGQVIHLAYCSNVHPAEDLPSVLAQLDRFVVPVREHLGEPVVGLGLWLAAPVAEALDADATAVSTLRRELDARGIEVVTLNGFPYRAFHGPVVKHTVYHPDWTTTDRLVHTLRLARVLAGLLPDEATGSISTLPLAWRSPWGTEQADHARRKLEMLAAGLAELHRRTGHTIQVGLEPEPGCVVETTEQAGLLLTGMDPRWLGICLDLAHLACAWEVPEQALARLRASGLPLVKVQVSAALEVGDPTKAAGTLRPYAEPRFLHQTRNPAGAGRDDLAEALAERLPGPWRVHFHLPLHADPPPPLTSTIAVTRDALAALLAGPTAACTHFEVETYTWQVLPQPPVTDTELAAGIAAELRQLHQDLIGYGLTAAAHDNLGTST
jgi:sugar phosphate isomerase/epimerase